MTTKSPQQLDDQLDQLVNMFNLETKSIVYLADDKTIKQPYVVLKEALQQLLAQQRAATITECISAVGKDEQVDYVDDQPATDEDDVKERRNELRKEIRERLAAITTAKRNLEELLDE